METVQSATATTINTLTIELCGWKTSDKKITLYQFFFSAVSLFLAFFPPPPRPVVVLSLSAIYYATHQLYWTWSSCKLYYYKRKKASDGRERGKAKKSHKNIKPKRLNNNMYSTKLHILLPSKKKSSQQTVNKNWVDVPATKRKSPVKRLDSAVSLCLTESRSRIITHDIPKSDGERGKRNRSRFDA